MKGTREWLPGAPVGEERKWGWLAMVQRFWGTDENSLKLDYCDLHNSVNFLKFIELYSSNR